MWDSNNRRRRGTDFVHIFGGRIKSIAFIVNVNSVMSKLKSAAFFFREID